MRTVTIALFCGALALAPAACTRQEAPVAATPAAAGATTFEITPAIGVATGVTFVVALGIMAIVACGIACAGS